MYEIIKAVLEIQAPFNIVIVCVALGLVASAIGAIASEVRKFATHRMDLDFKREMIEQGVAAEEVERVLQAGGSGKTGSS